MAERTAVTKGELPCIWVLAGVLSYRLCDRNYECESCDLYRALRGGDRGQGVETEARPPANASSASERDTEELVSSYVCRLTQGCVLHLDCPYCRSHFWLRRTAADRVLVGLDGHLLRLLYPIDDITLPHVGVSLGRDAPCGWITHGQLTVPLDSPIAGKVEAVNDRYIETLIGDSAFAAVDEWMLCLEAREDIDSLADLYRGEQTLVWYLSKVQLIKRYLREALSEAGNSVGVTLSDGGEPNLNMEQVLGRERFKDLVNDLFRMQI